MCVCIVSEQNIERRAQMFINFVETAKVSQARIPSTSLWICNLKTSNFSRTSIRKGGKQRGRGKKMIKKKGIGQRKEKREDCEGLWIVCQS